MYDWVTTTTIDNENLFTHIQYVYVYETYYDEDEIIDNQE